MASYNAMFHNGYRAGDTIASYYTLDKQIGNGSHATVWQGRNINGEHVALKQMSFDLESERLKRTYREIKLLQHFSKQENIVYPIDLVTNNTKDKFETVFLVMELCQTDLHKLLRSSQKITPDHVKLFSFQLLCGLRALHNANVVHRDLKPQNILITQNNNIIKVMICDLGTGRFVNDDHVLRQTSLNCVTSAFYCAPEGILDKDFYSTSVDIWALGCIIAEMIKRTPLFECRDPKQQLKMIVDVCGKPMPEDLQDFPDSSKKRYLLECPSMTESIEDKLPEVDAITVDFIKKLLVFHPKNRLTAVQAYAHQYLEPLNRNNADLNLDPFDDLESSREKLTPEEWKDLLWEEIETYHKKKEQHEACTKEQPAENDLWGYL